MSDRDGMHEATGALEDQELERVAGGTRSLEDIPGIGPYVTVFRAIKDTFEATVQDFRDRQGNPFR